MLHCSRIMVFSRSIIVLHMVSNVDCFSELLVGNDFLLNTLPCAQTLQIACDIYGSIRGCAENYSKNLNNKHNQRGSRTALTRREMDSTRSLKVCCGIWHQDASSRSFKSYPHSVHSDNAACRPKKPNLKSTGDHVAQDSPYVSLRGTASPDSKAQRNEKAHYLLKAISQRSEEADQIFIKFFNKMFELSVIESKIDNFQHRFHDVV
ncbi:hypothetical protein QTP70_011181 [Hemibagrus guttatus]|uniref:Uncharacterized protein n=1 Tax=Hemibagrus guttatus TaxID=175788 RepID=A0AAE0UYR4_9TELE|nr:hypothetical protein QTP70_011181 [Hemibagrus guttatus]